MLDDVHRLIGSDAETILWWQMVIRGILVFFITLLLVRLGSRRIFGRNSGFDIVLAVILGSVMSRALTANARFFPTLSAAAALVLLHWLLAILSRRSRAVGRLIKGTETLLVRDGQVQEDALRKTKMTEHDIMEAIRSTGGASNLAKVKEAYLERSGRVSVIVD